MGQLTYSLRFLIRLHLRVYKKQKEWGVDMNIFVMNDNFEKISIIDSYESVIWTDRYIGYGDFEIYAPFSFDLLNKVKQDYYLTILNSEHVMIIESVEILSDTDKGNRLKITGKSLESILNRRIMWSKAKYTGSLQDAIKSILTNSIISPSIEDRKISNFIFEESNDERITSLTIEDEFTEEQNVYDIIVGLCERNYLGYRITLNSSNQFVFKLYMGEDRSYDQLTNPYVVFSPNYENIINSNYIDSTEKMKNITLVIGEQTSITVGSGTGLARREVYTDGMGVNPKEVGDYNESLKRLGTYTLQDNSRVKNFEGEVDAVRMFVYGKDFFIGDVVQISNEYGIEGSARVMEFIKSDDASGSKAYPTFQAIQDINSTVTT